MLEVRATLGGNMHRLDDIIKMDLEGV